MSQALLLGGMHRSGTSLVAGMLSRMGVHMGDRLLAPDSGNQYGYFEDRDVLDFHTAVLRARGLDAFPTDATLFPIHLTESERRLGERLAARRASRAVWGWKDPRTTLFLDFWSSCVRNALFLIPYREPLTVVDSLLRRRKDRHITNSPVIALRAWTTFNTLALEHAERNPANTLLLNVSQFQSVARDLVSRLTQHGIPIVAVEPDDVYVAQGLAPRPRRTTQWHFKYVHRGEYRLAVELHGRLCRSTANLRPLPVRKAASNVSV